jgi:crotonobetainyl-CoA:carnitine CoA-transferase CaiB-like acyl-CoA transferase
MKVVDLSRSTAGQFCSKLLAMAGEDVTRFVPLADGERTPSWSAALRQSYLQVDPTIPIDWDRPVLLDGLDSSLGGADVIISSYQGGKYESPYDDARIRSLNPTVVHLTLSPFGTSGPYSGLRTSSLVEWAASGYLYITGEPNLPPLPGPAELCGYVAGYMATLAVEAALACQSNVNKQSIWIFQ